MSESVLTPKKIKNPLFAVLLICLLSYLIFNGLQVINIGAVYKAKLLCTNTFFAGRDPDRVQNEDLTGPERFIKSSIDYSSQSVSAGISGIVQQQAFYLEGLGCVWSADIDKNEFKTLTKEWTSAVKIKTVANKSVVFSENFNHPEFDQQQLKTAIDNAFSELDLDAPTNTRAILVVYQGQLISERYAMGISKDMPLQGWSMTKSVMNALVGILVKQGKLSIDKKVLIPAWAGADDPRSKITLDQLLRMSSGLEFEEQVRVNVTDLSEMLFLRGDAAAFAIDKPLTHQPDTHWHYSSGTTNIISRIAREASGGSIADIITMLQNELFIPLGMQQAIIEPDSSGNLIGSSYMYANARDWARFGQLYLQDGQWQGKRILPEGWVKYSSTPTPAAPKGKYGAHFWTNGGINSTSSNRPFPGLPGDLYFAAGYKGQRVIIIPSQRLVIVRLGWSDDASPQKMETMVLGVLNAKLTGRFMK